MLRLGALHRSAAETNVTRTRKLLHPSHGGHQWNSTLVTVDTGEAQSTSKLAMLPPDVTTTITSHRLPRPAGLRLHLQPHLHTRSVKHLDLRRVCVCVCVRFCPLC